VAGRFEVGARAEIPARRGLDSPGAPGATGRCVIFGGKTGRGKMHLAVAIAYRAIQKGFGALFVNRGRT
jgi:chromosomal replication initiation ATPase DnaA